MVTDKVREIERKIAETEQHLVALDTERNQLVSELNAFRNQLHGRKTAKIHG